MSESHFMSLFKRVTGLSFVTYVNHFRSRAGAGAIGKDRGVNGRRQPAGWILRSKLLRHSFSPHRRHDSGHLSQTRSQQHPGRLWSTVSYASFVRRARGGRCCSGTATPGRFFAWVGTPPQGASLTSSPMKEREKRTRAQFSACMRALACAAMLHAPCRSRFRSFAQKFHGNSLYRDT